MDGDRPGEELLGLPDDAGEVVGGKLVQAGKPLPAARPRGDVGELGAPSLTPEGRRLSEQQRRFLWEYAKHGNGAEAARAIGACPSQPSQYGMRVLKRKAAQTELAAIRASMRSSAVADGIEIREALTEVLRAGRPFERVAAAQELAKLDGLYPKEEGDRGEVKILQVFQLGPL